MENNFIMQLPDDCLYFIFQQLKSYQDRESFGLTCKRWLHIQNSTRLSLQFECSFTQLSISSLSRTSTNISSFHLSQLLNRFKHLQSLSLSGCIDLPDSALVQLQNYGPTLQSLYLDCCFGITDNGLSFIALGCHSLTIISLYRCNITDNGLHSLSNSCLALRDIDLSYCSLISDQGIKSLTQNCRQIRAVRISYCRSISGSGFRDCSPTLTYLEADSCKIEPEGTLSIISGGGLEYLSVSNLSWSIHGNGLTSLVTKNLKVLNFRCCRTIGDETIIAIAKGCPLLKEWNMALCHEIRIEGWKSIGLFCVNLERIHVNRCRNLCDRGLQFVRDGCKKLEVLYISGCRQISSISMEMFKILRGDVEIIQEEVMCIAPDWAFKL